MRPIPRLIFLSLGILTLGALASPSLAEVYRWKDDNGKTVFGDTPPKDKTSIAVPISNTENTGTQFATPQQIKNIERDAASRQQFTQPRATKRIDSHCRRYISQLNKIEIFLEHTRGPRDQQKAQDLRNIIKKECSNKLLSQKFDDYRCKRYRNDVSRIDIFLEHTNSPRDQQKAQDLRKQISRECR